MGNSLMVMGGKLGMDVRLCASWSLRSEDGLVAICRQTAVETGDPSDPD
ncbi:MAG: hypothetical protein K1X65_00975 [Caldilineales bacterium]|nr:hypothetical protein [Caldilineales bacterium]